MRQYTWGPPTGKNTCTTNSELYLRISLYRVRRHRGPLNLWSQLTQLNRVSQLTQLTRLTQLTQLTSTGSTGSGDLVWPPGQVNHCDQYHCYYYVSTGSIGVNWVHWVRRFSVGAWSIRPRLLLLRVNWVKWVHWGQLG